MLPATIAILVLKFHDVTIIFGWDSGRIDATPPVKDIVVDLACLSDCKAYYPHHDFSTPSSKDNVLIIMDITW
jgi:hypothetical protein